MTGSYDIVVKNSIVQFKFRVSRNITILRGDSATGKTTLVDMVRQHALEGDASGVSISSQKECTVLTGIRWQDEIRAYMTALYSSMKALVLSQVMNLQGR